MDIQDLEYECGTVVVPGIKKKVYAVCACDIDTWPDFLASVNVGDSITLDGDIILSAGKKFATVDITDSTGKLTHPQVGVIGSKNFTNKFEFELVKTLASDEWVNNHSNACFIFLIPEKDGKLRVLGNPENPAFFEAAEGTTGAANADAKNWTCTISDTTGYVSPYYTGAIDLTA